MNTMLKNRQLQVLKIEKIKGLALARCMSRHSGVRGRGSSDAHLTIVSIVSSNRSRIVRILGARNSS